MHRGRERAAGEGTGRAALQTIPFYAIVSSVKNGIFPCDETRLDCYERHL